MTFEEYLDQRIHIGSIPVPRKAETRHFFIIGRSGTGKTRLIYSMIEKIRRQQGKAIIYDFKGDYISCFFNSETDLLFNPLDLRTLHWSIFDEIEMISDVDSIATSLIPPSRSEDKFWTDGARDVFSSILYFLKVQGKEDNQILWEHLSMAEEQLLNLIQNAVNAFGLEFCKKALGYLLGIKSGSKVAPDVLSTMKQYVNCFFYVRHLRREFSIKKWLEDDKPGFLFLVGFPKLRDTLKPLLSLFIDVAIKHTLSLSESFERRIYFVIDEFVTLQKLPTVVQGLEQGRSKGLSLILALQDFNQLERIYSETAYSILNNCSTIISFALNDPRSQEVFSKVCGETEKLESDESLSMGVEDTRDGLSLQRRRKTERLLLPSEFSTLQDLTAFVKILHYPIAKVRIPFISFPVRNKSVELNPIFVFSNEVNNDV